MVEIDFKDDELEVSKDTSNLDITKAKLVRVEYETKGWKHFKYIWQDPSFEEQQLVVGQRVWPAGESYSDYFELKEIFLPGSKFYPEGGYLCSTGTGVSRSFDLECLIKHPGKKEFKERKITKKRKKK